MNRRKAIQSAVLGAGAAAVPAALAGEKDSSVFAARWEKAKVFTLKVTDAMPADSFGFKPKPEMRGFGELMAHIGSGNVFYMSRFNKGETPESLTPPKVFDKETVKKYLTDSFDFAAGLIQKLTDADLDKSYPGRPNAPAQTGWDWLLNGFIHTAHHRGYAEVYLREKGITPPTYSV
ncbi:MAG TPA: DinB family protein [Bryobacteraceae bacterium]|nr:DinB family protein [Bryobacteraceae bacterium]